MKIVSMAPNITEMIYYFGMQDSLAGVTDYCNYPEDALTKTRVGSFGQFNQEKMLLIKPDIVIFSGNMTSSGRSFLDTYKIKYFDIKMEDVNGLCEGAQSLAVILGCPEKYAAFKIFVDSVLDANREIISGSRVYIEISNRPVMCSTEKSYSGSIVKHMGGVLPMSEALTPYAVISQEDIITFNPNVIIAADFDSSISSRMAWSSIDAVRKDRVAVLSQMETDILSRPGPRIAEAFEILRRISYE